MEIKINWLIFSVLVVFCQFTYANQVPKDLPSTRSIELFQEYTIQKNHKAFVISMSGPYSAFWGMKSSKEARKHALNNCKKHKPVLPCRLINLDGKPHNGVTISPIEMIDSTKLINQKKLAQQRIWVNIDRSLIPKDLVSNLKVIKHYNSYLDKKGFKAFAASANGAWGYSFGYSTREQAWNYALRNCADIDCKILMINHDPQVELVNINNY